MVNPLKTMFIYLFVCLYLCRCVRSSGCPYVANVIRECRDEKKDREEGKQDILEMFQE